MLTCFFVVVGFYLNTKALRSEKMDALLVQKQLLSQQYFEPQNPNRVGMVLFLL